MIANCQIVRYYLNIPKVIERSDPNVYPDINEHEKYEIVVNEVKLSKWYNDADKTIADMKFYSNEFVRLDYSK